jgi:PBS lyase HEAT-like repeat
VAGNQSRRLTWIGWALGTGAVILVAAFAGITLWIRADVRNATEMAVREYPGDGTLALIVFVESDDHPLAERNRAVWALGQLRDPRALPTLERHYTGKPCDHARMLCQYELKKAIDLVRPHAEP